MDILKALDAAIKELSKHDQHSYGQQEEAEKLAELRNFLVSNISIPKGWVIVPITPTPEMRFAFNSPSPNLDSRWHAVVEASPKCKW